KNVARRLHHTLTFDDPPTRVAIEFWPEAFEDRLSRFLDLKEQRIAIAAREQTDRAERADAPDPNRLKSNVVERVAVEQFYMLWRKMALIGGKHGFSIDPVPRIALSHEMKNQRRLVEDPGGLTHGEARSVVILFKPLARFGEDRVKLSSQRAILDLPHFLPH